MTLTNDQVGDALSRLGKYRVQAAYLAAGEGPADGIGGGHMLALGLRESGLQNINNPAETDHGCFQMNEVWHATFLRSEPGCPAGTWKAVEGHFAIDNGYCPRYTPALVYALNMLAWHRAQAIRDRVPEKDAVTVALSAYNQGYSGALKGYRAGNVDAGTTGGDYSHWVLEHRTIVRRVLLSDRFKNWDVLA